MQLLSCRNIEVETDGCSKKHWLNQIILFRGIEMNSKKKQLATNESKRKLNSVASSFGSEKVFIFIFNFTVIIRIKRGKKTTRRSITQFKLMYKNKQFNLFIMRVRVGARAREMSEGKRGRACNFYKFYFYKQTDRSLMWTVHGMELRRISRFNRFNQ